MTKELLFRSYNGGVAWPDFCCKSDCMHSMAQHGFSFRVSLPGSRKKTATWQKKHIEPSPEWLGFTEAIPFEDQLLD